MIGGHYKALDVVTAPNESPDNISERKLKVFLAGGITGCRDWQNECLEWLDEILYNKDIQNVLVYNPRRETWDMNDPLAGKHQIEWEFENLERMDIFSMYFCTSDTSVGPICFYELGRNICRMQMRFPNSWKSRIVISTDKGYSRANDVYWQSKLAGNMIGINKNLTPQSHAKAIAEAIELFGCWVVNPY